MPDLIVQILTSRTSVPADLRELLAKGSLELTRKEKRLYRSSLLPRLEDYRRVLAEAYAALCRRDPSTPDAWATSIAFNILGRGYATLADTLGMAVVGRRKVGEVMGQLTEALTKRRGGG